MKKNNLFYLLILFTLFSCLDKENKYRNSTNHKQEQITKSDCDSSESAIIQSFPNHYFSKTPTINIAENDTLEITIWEKWKIPHTVNYSEVVSRVVYVLDSMNCFDIEEKLGTHKLKVIIYYQNESSDNRLLGYVSGTDLLGRWKNESYKKFNNLILNTNPSYFWRFDYFLESYFENYKNPIFNTNFHTVYESILGVRRYERSDDQLMDSLISASKFNSKVIDPKVIENIKSLSPLILAKNKELIITDQIPDSQKENSK